MTDGRSDAEALRSFRDSTVDEKLDELFLNQRAGLRESKGINARLDILNGTTKRTKDRLEEHLGDHGEQIQGINFIKKAGGYGTGLLLTTSIVMNIIQFFI